MYSLGINPSLMMECMWTQGEHNPLCPISWHHRSWLNSKISYWNVTWNTHFLQKVIKKKTKNFKDTHFRKPVTWIFLLLSRSFLVACSPTSFFFPLCFCCLWFWCHIHEIIASTNVKEIFPYSFFLRLLWFQILHLSLQSLLI